MTLVECVWGRARDRICGRFANIAYVNIRSRVLYHVVDRVWSGASRPDVVFRVKNRMLDYKVRPQ